MNKLTKQLLSLGLSVVTVAGMVSPVFAEEVDETLENSTPIAEVSNETNVNERAALKTITVQLVIHERGPYIYSDCAYKDVSVEIAQDATYDEYPYKADIVLPEIGDSLVPTVIFSLADSESGNFAPVAESGAGYVRIWAKEKPEEAVVIPTILCQ